ncbi:MAG: Beta-galactosidase [Phycisphaerae bacterium]|nr:Beta-galactosidase [Phycisphaerae bacterium]
MIRIDLGSKTRWEFRRARNWDAWVKAAVPGCVHTDLLAAGLIDDPFVGTRELDVLWIDQADWDYRRTFDAPAPVREQAVQILRFEGLDTVADVRLNGRRLGSADNMFRRWDFDVTGLLKPRGNELLVRFTGPVKAARARAARDGRQIPGDTYPWGQGRTRYTARNRIRKAQYQFGWDWGPQLTTSGIWRAVELIAHSGPRIDHVAQRQAHRRGRVEVTVTADLAAPSATRCTLRVRLGDASVDVALKLRKGTTRAEATLTVRDPRLWWPAGYGDQPLYDLRVELRGGDGAALDSADRRVGLRQVELVRKPDKQGESFKLRVNGRDVYCKGANWIPADIFPTRVARADYEHLIGQAVAANMNILRIWGGGIYEHDDFYDLCDRRGVMLWHDHMFACSSYPATREFLDNVAAEITHQVRRLSCHPSIVLWCGNNENEQAVVDWWANRDDIELLRREYRTLTDREAAVTRAEAPDLPWWPSSASSGGNLVKPNSTDRGDCHFWEVWHQRKPFSRYLEIKPRFQSEFGFQSFPDPRTLHPVITGDDQWNLTSPQMEHHQRSGVGNSVICETLTRHFRLPERLDDFFHVSQLLQASAIQMGIEHWRRIKPVCWGTIYWQINDCWPVASWSSIDSAGRLKALHYFARRFYAPLLISGIETDGRVELWLTSDLAERLAGDWQVEVWSLAGKRRERIAGRFALAPDQSRCIASWPIERFAADLDARDDVMLHLTAKAGGRSAENSLFLAPYKRMALPRARVEAKVAPAGRGAMSVTLRSDATALFAWCDAGEIAGDWSDNCVHLLPGRPRRLRFVPRKPTTAAALANALTVRTLRDTY